MRRIPRAGRGLCRWPACSRGSRRCGAAPSAPPWPDGNPRPIHNPEPEAMMRARLALILLLATPAALAAETPMTGAEFEAYATGKILTYAENGAVWGTEQYKPNRRVVWAFTASECRDGYWYEKGDQICFVYEDPNDPQCWWFYRREGGIAARFVGDPDGITLSEVAQSDGPMPCAGPDVGV